MKDKTIGFIISQENLKVFASQNNQIIKKIAENFKEVFVINVLDLKLGNAALSINTIDKNLFPENVLYKNIKTSKEFVAFFKNKD